MKVEQSEKIWRQIFKNKTFSTDFIYYIKDENRLPWKFEPFRPIAHFIFLTSVLWYTNEKKKGKRINSNISCAHVYMNISSFFVRCSKPRNRPILRRCLSNNIEGEDYMKWKFFFFETKLLNLNMRRWHFFIPKFLFWFHLGRIRKQLDWSVLSDTVFNRVFRKIFIFEWKEK